PTRERARSGARCDPNAARAHADSLPPHDRRMEPPLRAASPRAGRSMDRKETSNHLSVGTPSAPDGLVLAFHLPKDRLRNQLDDEHDPAPEPWRVDLRLALVDRAA